MLRIPLSRAKAPTTNQFHLQFNSYPDNVTTHCETITKKLTSWSAYQHQLSKPLPLHNVIRDDFYASDSSIKSQSTNNKPVSPPIPFQYVVREISTESAHPIIDLLALSSPSATGCPITMIVWSNCIAWWILLKSASVELTMCGRIALQLLSPIYTSSPTLYLSEHM